MLATLREGFVNCWLLAKDLETIAALSEDPELGQLCKLIRENYEYPVDSVLITPDLRVVGHVNVNSLEALDPGHYRTFLRRGLATARGEEFVPEPEVADEGRGEKKRLPRSLTLTPGAPTDSLLEVIQCTGPGKNGFTYYRIDATAFAGGGTLEIEVRLGNASASGKFELCAARDAERQLFGPVQTIQSLAPGGSDRFTLEFASGAPFGLAVMTAAGAEAGDVNAFLATVTVRGR